MYKYFSGAGKVCLNTSHASPAPERYQISNTSPAPGENEIQREDHSKQRDPQSRKPFSVWWQCEHVAPKNPLGGRAERSATRAGRSQVEELQKRKRRVTKNTMV